MKWGFELGWISERLRCFECGCGCAFGELGWWYVVVCRFGEYAEGLGSIVEDRDREGEAGDDT